MHQRYAQRVGACQNSVATKPRPLHHTQHVRRYLRGGVLFWSYWLSPTSDGVRARHVLARRFIRQGLVRSGRQDAVLDGEERAERGRLHLGAGGDAADLV